MNDAVIGDVAWDCPLQAERVLRGDYGFTEAEVQSIMALDQY